MPRIKSINCKLVRCDIRLPENINASVEMIAEKETIAKGAVLRRIVCEYFKNEIDTCNSK